MKDSNFPFTNTNNNKRTVGDDGPSLPLSSNLPYNKKPKKHITKSAFINLQNFDIPLISSASGSPLDSICLESDRLYTVGRTGRHCDFVFHDCRVSKQHCQILFDGIDRKIYILDGSFLLHDNCTTCVATEFRKRLHIYDRLEVKDKEEIVEGSSIRASLNGLFVNGVRVKRGATRELCAGDEVLLVCGNEGMCNSRVQIGFVIQRVVIKEEVTMGSSVNRLGRPRLRETTTSMGHSQGSMSSGNRNKRVFAIHENEIVHPHNDVSRLKCGGLDERAEFLLSRCRHILHNDDPTSCFRQYALSDFGMERGSSCKKKLKDSSGVTLQAASKVFVGGEMAVNSGLLLCRQESRPHENSHVGQPHKNSCIDQNIQNNREEGDIECICIDADHLHDKDISRAHSESAVSSNGSKASSLNYVCKENAPHYGGVLEEKTQENYCPAPGKKFYLNRLKFMNHSSFSHHDVISLPELLYPIGSILRMFIVTFTSDIPWFLSYCQIPCQLPVTIACHNTERCWSSSPDKRTSVPCSNFPNLLVVFPPFPEEIAFGKDRKRQGISCHHPKLLVLQREDCIRVIITSANLVENQWNNVTNTIWWQDFPRRSAADISSLFIQVSDGEINQDSRSDFAAQLAGFMASLLIDVPSQAHWIIELTKYNFEGATGYLIASVPGIHSFRSPSAYHHALESFGTRSLGSVDASVVGLSYLFRSAADTNGAQLKRLATFLGKSHKNASGMLEVVLRRNTHVPADANAVSIHVPNPYQFSEGDCIQLGFLPRCVAKWVSPLWDREFFRFSGYIYPKEAIAAALGGSNLKVHLILHVLEGPHFRHMMRIMQPEHVIAFCSLIASVQRCTGLWRLQEVLGQYKWPEWEQSDFIYGSSSIGSSVNAQFLAAFSAAAGKRSSQLLDSEESDPEWGCWSASQELRNPSIRILFPTIERVKNACNGILPSRHILCFSEKTWQRLRTVDIIHDAVPHPSDRVGRPMHVKVALRRFQSKIDASSCGWVYYGSHNFSAAAWGGPISNSSGLKLNEPGKTNSSWGSRLRVCNYELGIIFIFPSTETECIAKTDPANLDDIVLPFVLPAPKYGSTDRPATKRAMREALAELTDQERERLVELATIEEMIEEIPDEEEEVVEATDYVVEEKEEEKSYAEMLWIQVDSSQSG